QLFFCDLQECPAECLGLAGVDGGATDSDGGAGTAPPDADTTSPPDGPMSVEPDARLPIDEPDDIGGSDDARDASGDAAVRMIQSLACAQCTQTAKDSLNPACKTINGCDV